MHAQRRLILAAAASGLALLAAGAAHAQSVAYNAPNFISVPGATSVTMNGVTFTNQGLVGTARLPADQHDFNGETLGSFSGMSIDLASWRRAADGSYSASLYTLPDRGPNNIGGFTTTNYAARLNKFTMAFTPYTGSTALASNVQQMTLTQAGGFLLRDTTGALFTGRDPQAGTVTRDGVIYPTPPAGDAGAGRIAMDAEAVTFLNDGSFYIGDEYGAMIYYFDKTGRQIGAIQANPDLLPRVGGAVNFNGTNDAPLVPGSTGRRSNQGMEGVSVSPDGKRLFAVLQSATLQDNPTNVAVRRNNTRVLVYDISASKTPTAPIGEYVLQLPVYNNSLTGTGNASATAAQSEVLALNNTQFLVLSRDGNGRGTNGNANAIAFKSVLLVDINGATNIAGTPYSTGTSPTPISTTALAAPNGSGVLEPGITPVKQVELVNMLNTAQLTKFGINTTTAPSTQYTLSEKWEAMGLVPVLEENKPQDFFLLIGNDNDFVSADIDAAGVTDANAALNSVTAGVGNNDNVVLIYRLTLPTYIDPQALAYLQEAGPYAMAGARITGAQLGATAGVAGLQALDAQRRAGVASGPRVWAQVGLARVSNPGAVGEVESSGLIAGVDFGDETMRFGAVASAQDYDGDNASPFDIDGESYGFGVYGGWYAKSGLYVQGSLSGASLNMNVSRPASYGLLATGQARGRNISGAVEAGYTLPLGGFSVTPFVNLRYTDVYLRGYAEQGAAVGNGAIPDSHYKRTETTFGGEAAFSLGPVRPSVRLGWTSLDEGGDTQANLALAAVAGSAGMVALPKADDSYLSATLAVEGIAGGFGWRAAVDLRDAEGSTDGQVNFGLIKRF